MKVAEYAFYPKIGKSNRKDGNRYEIYDAYESETDVIGSAYDVRSFYFYSFC